MMDQTSMNHTKMNTKQPMNMGHGKSNMMQEMIKQFWYAVIASVLLFFVTPVMGMTKPLLVFPGSNWVSLILASFLYFYCGASFLKGAVAELKAKSPAMDSLIALGITAAYFYSLYAFIENNFIDPQKYVMDFFFELATLIVIMLLGHIIMMRSLASAGNAVKDIAALLPNSAHLIQADGTTKDEPINQLKVGDLVMVKPGEKIPADGTIESGSTTVNESLVTGESKAVTKQKGAKVIGGSINGDGSINVKVTATTQNGFVGQIMKLVTNAEDAKSPVETKAETVAKYLFYAALGAALISFFVWLPQKGLAFSAQRFVATVVIACPHALGLAVPLVIARSTSIGAKNGLIVRNREVYEVAKKLNYVLLDKTGTLTEGKFEVHDVEATNGATKEQVLAIMDSLESHTDHPLATGIANEAKKENVQVLVSTNVTTVQGVGITGTIDGKQYRIVTGPYLQKNNIQYDQQKFDDLASQANSISYLINDQNTVLGLIAQGDQIKSTSKQLIADLKKRHLTPVMLTGDNEKTAAAVAKQLGIDDVHAQLLPQNKQTIVKEYQDKGDVVMMVGDGINDAPSLVQADIGVAIGAGTDAAIESANVILVRSNPLDIITFLRLAHSTDKKMTENLWLGAGYNILAIPLAAGILAPIGFILPPAASAVLMSLSTIVVAINALTLHLQKD